MEVLKMPYTNEWIKKMWYLNAKKNDILPFKSKWMELENILLSEVSQAQKAKNHKFYIKCGL
jgi:hypothetical protein